MGQVTKVLNVVGRFNLFVRASIFLLISLVFFSIGYYFGHQDPKDPNKKSDKLYINTWFLAMSISGYLILYLVINGYVMALSPETDNVGISSGIGILF